MCPMTCDVCLSVKRRAFCLVDLFFGHCEGRYTPQNVFNIFSPYNVFSFRFQCALSSVPLHASGGNFVPAL